MTKESTRTTPFFWPAVLSLLLVGLFLTPLRTVDLWWQLDSGRWMLEHGQYLGHEVHSFSMPGAAWPNFSWLFQVLVACVEWAGGMWGLLVLKASVWWLMLFLLLRSTDVDDVPVAMLLAPLLFSVQLFPFMCLRPHLFEGVFLACAVWLFHRQRSSRDPLWYALLILLWANSHASVVLGAAALALHYVWGADFRLPPFRTLWQRLPIGLLLGMLVFATPNGIGILKVLLKHADGEYLHVYIREWFSPEFMPPLMFVALLAIAGGAWLRRDLLTPAERLLIVFFLIAGGGSRRFLYELSLLLVRPSAILLRLLLLRFASKHKSGGSYQAWLYGLLFITLLTASYGMPFAWGRLHLADYPVIERQFPHVAIAVLKPVLDGEPELRVWNDYGCGGYLEWHGKERLKVYIDGRTPTVFTEEMMLNDKLARTHPEMLRSLLAHWKAGAVVLRWENFLPIPPNDPTWILVGFDNLSAIYLRSDLAQRYGLAGIGFDPFRKWPSVDAPHLGQAIQSVRRLLAQDADNDLAWQRLGQLLGDGNEEARTQAMAAFQRAIDLNPENGFARLGLARMRQLAGMPTQQVAQPLLDLLDASDAKGFMGFEEELATLLLDTGHAQQALNILSPDDWRYHQQLDTNFNVWLLRSSAHSSLGKQVDADFDWHMAKQLARDAGPSAMKRLQAFVEGDLARHSGINK
jgi:tetratricopeptide (TPR) repeat protein